MHNLLPNQFTINRINGKEAYKNASDIYSLTSGNNLLLIYKGEINEHITSSVLNMAEKNMERIGEESMTRKRVFNVMVECLQNIAKHADEAITHTGKKYNSLFLIGQDEDGYYIVSGNAVYGSKVEEMERRLNLINSLNKEELKAYYLKIMANCSIDAKGGASLGFIEMARKSGNQLQYSFEAIDNVAQFFVLQTNIFKRKIA